MLAIQTNYVENMHNETTFNYTCAQKASILYSYYLENDYYYTASDNGLPNMKDVYNKRQFIKAHKEMRKRAKNNKNKNVEPENTCPVCYEYIDDGKVILGCKHSFCLDCYNNFHIRNNQCPMCREEFTEKKYHEMPEDYLESLSSTLRDVKFRFGQSEEKITFEDKLNTLLRNMNYSNMKDTKNIIMNMFDHYVLFYGDYVSQFYGKQLFP